jgi:hypothetical protein
MWAAAVVKISGNRRVPIRDPSLPIRDPSRPIGWRVHQPGLRVEDAETAAKGGTRLCEPKPSRAEPHLRTQRSARGGCPPNPQVSASLGNPIRAHRAGGHPGRTAPDWWHPCGRSASGSGGHRRPVAGGCRADGEGWMGRGGEDTRGASGGGSGPVEHSGQTEGQTGDPSDVGVGIAWGG